MSLLPPSQFSWPPLHTALRVQPRGLTLKPTLISASSLPLLQLLNPWVPLLLLRLSQLGKCSRLFLLSGTYPLLPLFLLLLSLPMTSICLSHFLWNPDLSWSFCPCLINANRVHYSFSFKALISVCCANCLINVCLPTWITRLGDWGLWMLFLITVCQASSTVFCAQMNSRWLTKWT